MRLRAQLVIVLTVILWCPAANADADGDAAVSDLLPQLASGATAPSCCGASADARRCHETPPRRGVFVTGDGTAFARSPRWRSPCA